MKRLLRETPTSTAVALGATLIIVLKILFLVAVGGFLAQASKISLTSNDQSNLGGHEHNWERSGHAKRSEEVHRLVPITYLFSTSVTDSSRGFFQSRTEERNQNGQVKGEYSYMDGYYKVKVVYTAGPNGFRVIRQERIPLKKLKPASSMNPHEQSRERNVNFKINL